MSIESNIQKKFSNWAKITSIVTFPFWGSSLAIGVFGVYGIIETGFSYFLIPALLVFALGFWGLSSCIRAFLKPKLATLGTKKNFIKMIGYKEITKKIRMTHLHLENGKIASAPISKAFYEAIIAQYPNAREGFSDENIQWWHRYRKGR